ncbi:hypothetical protein [Paludibacterium paludis]|uniref:hypothetical protein n=1 Tax=Paludibacterium paludis TaxID=1225769 RepID=UPI00167BEC03|nr:hypothetical protein [Paludibacterium paludis]
MMLAGLARAMALCAMLTVCWTMVRAAPAGDARTIRRNGRLVLGLTAGAALLLAIRLVRVGLRAAGY